MSEVQITAEATFPINVVDVECKFCEKELTYTVKSEGYYISIKVDGHTCIQLHPDFGDDI